MSIPANAAPNKWLRVGRILYVGNDFVEECQNMSTNARNAMYRVIWPRVWRAVLGRRLRRSSQPGHRRLTNPPASFSSRQPPVDFLGKPDRIDHSSTEASFLRSFDRLEEIFEEALRLQLGELAQAFALRDRVDKLEQAGFLITADLSDWADCLAVRRSLLLAGEGMPGISSRAVEDALTTMMHLQVRLTDRRRAMFPHHLP